MTIASRWQQFWFGPQGPLNLGISRALCFAMLAWVYLPVSFVQWAELGRQSAFWNPIYPFGNPHLRLPLAGATGLMVLQGIWKCSLVLACIGFFTRISALVTFVIGAYLIGLTFNYGKVEHQTLPVILTMGILALSHCGDGFSIDAWLRRRRSQLPLPSGEYRWPIRMVWLLMSIVFCAAGIAKLRETGIHWVTGSGFSLLMIQRYYSSSPPSVRWGLLIANHRLLAVAFAGGSLFTELLFPLSMFDKRARVFFPLATFLMQLGIGLVMNIWFIQFLAIYGFWVPWDRWLKKPAHDATTTVTSPQSVVG